jgi:hypothetical protein
MSTAIGERPPSKKPAALDVPRHARQSKARLDCRATTIKSNVTKISLAFVSRHNNHHLAATAKMALLFAATLPSRLTRYTLSTGFSMIAST